MIEAEKAIRDAIAAGPTAGPWVSMPPPAKSYSDHGFRAVCKQWRLNEPNGVYAFASNMLKEGRGFVWGDDANYIAACNPAAMTELLAEIERLRYFEHLVGEIDGLARNGVIPQDKLHESRVIAARLAKEQS